MAARADIIIDQGTTFETVVTVTDDDGNVVNLTDYEAASQIRKHHTSSSVTSTFVITNSLEAVLGFALSITECGFESLESLVF